MKKKIVAVLILTIAISSMSLLAGCGRSKNADDGFFDSASEDYTILDEGEKDNSGSDNTNTKKASGRKNKEKSQKGSSSPSAAPESSDAESGNQNSPSDGQEMPSGIENETPFVPADEYDNWKKPGRGKPSGNSIAATE